MEREILRNKIRRGQVERDIERYASIRSRHVSHPGNWEAVYQLYEDLYRAGGGHLWFRPQPFTLKDDKDEKRLNVEALLPGVRSPHVIIIACHLDCTAERDTAYIPRRGRAPGADDDASGMAGVLAATRAIVALSQAQQPGEPRAEIRFVFFNAEEQGQRGSQVYAKQQKQRAVPISAVYQMDMIGYRSKRNEVFELHVGFKRDPATEAASLKVAQHLTEVCEALELPLTPQIYYQRKRSRDPGQGFSDHTSFHRHGFPAVMISEDFFPGQETFPAPGDPNPDYHTPDDVIGNLDTRYTTNIAHAVTAAAWHRATRIGCCCRCCGGHAVVEHGGGSGEYEDGYGDEHAHG
ncbi:MAG TPA: M20/M25/M40 family metallo-hydrolase [Longimicrobium sp.]|nr:M20/M25/M40 family metallo-hydrolase [Longimicrobium sp.]